MRWLLLFAVLISPVTLLAGLDDDFRDAIKSYDSGNFSEAAVEFQSIADRGYRSSELFYNLGCAYFKAGHLGRAIVNFRRAERLTPDDEDISINSQFARLYIVDKIDTGARPFFPDKVGDWLAKLHPNYYLWFSLAALLLTFGFLSLKRMGILSGSARGLALLCLAIAVLSVVAMVWVLKANYLIDEGVVVAAQTEVLSGPGNEFELQFEAHEGLLFRILDRREDYYLGLFANKLKGWVKSADVERI